MLTDRSWLDAAATRKLVIALDRGGVDFRFVGGAVRDSLLGREVSDIDVATPAPPDRVMQALDAAGLKAVPTGIAHGTVTTVVDGKPFEITTLRHDVETDGRHAVVAFTDDWQADAARRDFTMNALYANRLGSIFDYFQGVEDARAGRVRFIGDPCQRITEDALRILRFFRFHAWYGGSDPDAEGLAACVALAGLIERLSGERVRTELLKLLRAPDPVSAWKTMLDAGIAARALPDAARVGVLQRLTALEAEIGLDPDPLRRLAALIGPQSPEQISALKQRLKLSNRDKAFLTALGALDRHLLLVEERAFARALYRVEPAWLQDAALLANARIGRPEGETIAALHSFMATWRQPRFPLTGIDLKQRGIAAGPNMGRLLSDLESWWVAGGLEAGRSACLAELDRRLAA